jgi:hypothetical protein
MYAPSYPFLSSKLASSEFYQTYLRIFDWAFELPLYVEIGGVSQNLNPERRSAFCGSVNRGDACCSRCPLRLLPDPGKLEPWVWSASCAAGLQVTLAPVSCGSANYGWMITGHHAAGCLKSDSDLIQSCRAVAVPLSEEKLVHYHDVRVFSGSGHDGMKHYLELAGAMIGAEINSILLADDPAESVWTTSLKLRLKSHPTLSLEPTEEHLENHFLKDTGLSTLEFLQRWKIEVVRREIMLGRGTRAEILAAAHRGGCPDHAHFQKLFFRFFSEAPEEHVRRMKKVESQLWARTAVRA